VSSNIVTKRGERNSLTLEARSETGTDGAFLGGVAMRGGGENYDVALSGVFRRTDGFNISDFGNEEDGDRNTTLNGQVHDRPVTRSNGRWHAAFCGSPGRNGRSGFLGSSGSYARFGHRYG
jgi:outer membrane cobalamin receptor